MIEQGSCPDRDRQINHLPAGQGFGEGQERGGAILDVVTDGTASLGLTDKKERTRAGLQLRSDGTALLNFNDTNDKVRAVLGVGADGTLGLGIWNKDGKRIWQAPPAADQTR